MITSPRVYIIKKRWGIIDGEAPYGRARVCYQLLLAPPPPDRPPPQLPPLEEELLPNEPELLLDVVLRSSLEIV